MGKERKQKTTHAPFKMPIGAEVTTRGVRFRVWAPRCKRVDVVIEEGDKGEKEKVVPLAAETQGYFSTEVKGTGAGALYRFRLDNGDQLIPDPASRFQPQGPHGPSQVIDPTRFAWTDGKWEGLPLRGQVMYEMHCGTFTQEGTWRAASRELKALADIGITLLEIMPVGEFPGRFGWGYDAVYPYAPFHGYGSPDDLRRFVDAAHKAGIAVVLDVVYNHVGPDGNYFKEFSSSYFTKKYKTDWGDPFNFDGKDSGPVREFFRANAAYWVAEYHMDGVRLDATQNIYDSSDDHILAAITRSIREAGGKRRTLVIAENEPQQTEYVRPVEEGGFGMDGLWNDDFHHSALVALTGLREAYFTDYRGQPQEFVAAAKYGYLYQGQRYKWQKKSRGSPTFGVPPEAFITFIENHDQVPNASLGRHLHQITSPSRFRAMTALMLLGPGTPMLFQGQEFAASTPFHYFADHIPEIAKKVHEGRKKFLAQFRSFAGKEAQEEIPDPADPEVFKSSKLDLEERETHKEMYAFHRDLLKLRRSEKAFREQWIGGMDGAVISPDAFVLRFFEKGGDDRLLLVNLGAEISLEICPEPLIAPVKGKKWRVLWSSEDVPYGGRGRAPLELEENWCLPGNSALVLACA